MTRCPPVMTERIERVLVHVCDREGTVHGIGFLISRWYAVTCAHVVNAALHRKDLEARDRPGLDERVRLSFAVLDTKEIPDAAVVEWHPPRPFDEIMTDA